jgi:hypothetical protein
LLPLGVGGVTEAANEDLRPLSVERLEVDDGPDLRKGFLEREALRGLRVPDGEHSFGVEAEDRVLNGPGVADLAVEVVRRADEAPDAEVELAVGHVPRLPALLGRPRLPHGGDRRVDDGFLREGRALLRGGGRRGDGKRGEGR